MRKIFMVVFLGLCSFTLLFHVLAEQEDVRTPAFAGQFYPASPKALKLAVERYLKDAIPAGADKPLAIVAPHAGYIFAGQIAADAYNQVAGRSYDLVVILGTNHTTPGFNKVALYPGSGFRTPLGTAFVDKQVIDALVRKNPENFVKDASPHEQEHSVEVQIPFVQHLFPRARIVPVVIGVPDVSLCTRFGKALAEVLKDRNVLIVASSDLSHYPAAGDAGRVDRETLRAVVRLDPSLLHTRIEEQMGKGVDNLVTCACGEGPILAAIAAAKGLGATRGVAVSYANSGDVIIGESGRVVGYGAIALTAGKGESDTRALEPTKATSGGAEPLTGEQKQKLLAFAREVIDRFLTTETVPFVRGADSRLLVKQGAFVTLTKRGEARGCVGHLVEDMPLEKVVGWASLQAAFNDPRFTPLEESEWREVEIEISVLTPAKGIKGPEEIVVGRDGVLMEKDGTGAVFLPQVATEQRWSRDQMLDNLCLKAGLKAGCWKKDARFQTFQADVFHE